MTDRETPKTLNVLLYGLGAIGSFYAFVLSQSKNVRLTVVARSNYEAVKENGLSINSENHGNHVVRPDTVAKSPADVPGHYDYVVCTVKAVDQNEVPARLKPVVDDETTLVIIQNGVGNEDPFRKAFPNCSILTCVTWVGASQHTPGIVNHTKSENTQIGLFANPSLSSSLEQSRLETFTSLLTVGKTPFTIEADMQVARWEKVVWNAAWNSVTALTMLDTHGWLSSSDFSTPLTRRLMTEVIDVAKACGVALEYDLIDRLIDRILKMATIAHTSMQMDAREGRQMEVDVILGTPVRRAREMGMDVPICETLYTLLVAMNYRMKRNSK